MNNKVKIILIILEVAVLFVLLLLGVGCQQRWIIVTGNGPRIDWYDTEDTTESFSENTPPSDVCTEPPVEDTTQLDPPSTTETSPAWSTPETEPASSAPPTSPDAELEETEPPTDAEETEPPSGTDADTDPTSATDSEGGREDEFPLTPVD